MFHILLPVDRDPDRAIKSANIILDYPYLDGDITVTILNVDEEINVSSGDGMNFDTENLHDEDRFPDSVLEVEKLLNGRKLTVQKERGIGDPAETIVKRATELDVNRIVMSGRKRSPVGKVIFGSVTQSVVISTDIPVTVT